MNSVSSTKLGNNEAHSGGDRKEPDISCVANRLKNRIELAKGSKYEASRRHKHTNRKSTQAVVWLSFYVLTLTSIDVIFAEYFTLLLQKIVGIIAVLTSAFVIVFSLIQDSKRHQIRSELFLKCGQELSELGGKLETDIACKNISRELLLEYNRDYIKTISSYADNHADVDYNKYYARKNVYFANNEINIINYGRWVIFGALTKITRTAKINSALVFAIFVPWVIWAAILAILYFAHKENFSVDLFLLPEAISSSRDFLLSFMPGWLFKP